MSRFLLLIVFIAVLQLVGGLLGYLFPADAWYVALDKPFFTPSGQTFGLVWPILYLLIAIAGWKVFISGGETPGWGFWTLQMIFNWAYTPILFGAHLLFWSIWVLLGTLIFAIAFTVTTWNRDRLASLCFVPYVAWLGFALILNISLWAMN